MGQEKLAQALMVATSQLQEAVTQSQKMFNSAAAPSFLLRGIAQAAATVLEALASELSKKEGS